MELLRIWEAGDFRLELYYFGTGWGRVRLAYRLYDRGELIFDGDDFFPSTLHAFDGDESIAALLGFLALQPGDTNREYFEKYTPEQMAWVETRAEDLSLAVTEWWQDAALA